MENSARLDWSPIYLNNPKTDGEIQTAVATLMKIQPDEVLINRNYEWWENDTASDKYLVICDLKELEGDFPIYVWISPLDSKLPNYSVEYICELSQILDTKILARDKSIDPHDPYVWLLVQPNCENKLIELDMGLLDEKDMLKIGRYL